MEKEIDSFVIKSRSSSLFDLEVILKKLETNLEKLHRNLNSTEKECKEFKVDIDDNNQLIDNKD